MSDILITDFPMKLNGHWGACSDHIVIHGDGNVTDEKGRSIDNAKAVKLVRCRNCKHHSYDDIFGEYWCELPGRVRETTADGFCEKGEE